MTEWTIDPSDCVVVTSWNNQGYGEYGCRFMETFQKYWPARVQCRIVWEETPPEHIDKQRRFAIKNFARCGYARFARRHKRLMRARRYEHNVLKFAKKVFAVTTFANSQRRFLIWLDGDVVTHAPVTKAFLSSLLGEGAYCSFLGRRWSHSECGFLLFDTRHPAHADFFGRWRGYYETDEIFELEGWTDCHAFDATREAMTGEGRISCTNLSVPRTGAHVFINSRLGDVMDHLKGNRKEAGRSFAADLVAERTEAYWRHDVGASGRRLVDRHTESD